MGHVDHGKTTLLDYLRKSSVAASEAGGITQHMGAFSVRMPGSPEATATFIDTPGHEAFSQMRRRGASLTDMIILVIAVDDGIMPQTIESIQHARKANVPMIVAINKCDKPEGNADRIKRDLLRYQVQVEQLGGDTQAIPISGLSGKNVDQLMQAVMALSEVLELRALNTGPVTGAVLEAKMAPGKGSVATVLVLSGTLRPGSVLVCQESLCKVRSLTDAHGHSIKEAGPSMPVEVTGWRSLPPIGAEIVEVDDERAGSIMIEAWKAKRQLCESPVGTALCERAANSDGPASRSGLERPSHHAIISSKIQVQSEFVLRTNELNVILITDAIGSQEALLGALSKLPSNKVKLNVLRSSIGKVTQGDLDFADMTRSKILTFNVCPSKDIVAMVERRKIDLRSYDIIYRLIDDVVLLLTERLPDEFVERVSGVAQIAKVFELSGKDLHESRVAGCIVREGTIRKDNNDTLATVHVLRNDRTLYTGRIKGLKYLKKDVAAVNKGMECGILFDNFIDFQEGDVVQSTCKIAVKKTLV